MDLAEKTHGFACRHPWEVARRDAVCSVITVGSNGMTFADVGAGDLYVAQKIRDDTRSKVIADLPVPSRVLIGIGSWPR